MVIGHKIEILTANGDSTISQIHYILITESVKRGLPTRSHIDKVGDEGYEICSWDELGVSIIIENASTSGSCSREGGT